MTLAVGLDAPLPGRADWCAGPSMPPRPHDIGLAVHSVDLRIVSELEHVTSGGPTPRNGAGP